MLEFMVFQEILLLRLSAQLVKLNLLLEMLKGKLFLDPKKRKKKENQCTSWGWLIRVFYCQNFLCCLSFNGLFMYAVCWILFKTLCIWKYMMWRTQLRNRGWHKDKSPHAIASEYHALIFFDSSFLKSGLCCARHPACISNMNWIINFIRNCPLVQGWRTH